MITLEEHIHTLERIRYLIADLRVRQEKVERKILEETGRVEFTELEGKVIVANIAREGRKTETYGKYNLTITTDYLYRIDKDEYKIYKNQIPHGFDPVREIIKLDVDKSVMRDVAKYGSSADELLLGKFIERDFAKPSVALALNTKG